MEAFPNEIESVPSFLFAFLQFATAFFTILQEKWWAVLKVHICISASTFLELKKKNLGSIPSL